MWEMITRQLGPGFVVPALGMLILTWVAKLLWEVHASSRQSRRDFLDAWHAIDRSDDMALEVTVRHLLGTYLPADVLRVQLATSYPSRELTRTAELWPLLEWDRDARRVGLRNPAWSELRRCRIRSVGYLLAYLVLGVGAMYGLQFVLRLPPSSIVTWMLAVAFLSTAVAAFASLGRSDALWGLGRWGLQHVSSLNIETYAADALHARCRCLSGDVEIAASVRARLILRSACLPG